MRLSKYALMILASLLSLSTHAVTPAPDPWATVRFLVGEWTGTAIGEPGEGSVTRKYEFILNDQFIRESNTSTYRANEKNNNGEVHEHLGFISYDKSRKLIVMRQFHEEGFVNQYALNPTTVTATKVIFESEHFENFSNEWRARETYDILGSDEFVETFELAPPGKPFEIYSKNHFRRVVN